MTTLAPPHYVRHNKGTRVPHRWVYLDTEAVIERDGDTEYQRWRLGVTCFERNDTPKKTWTEPEWREWDDARALWAYIDSCTHRRGKTIVVAHNIGYDLRISSGLVHLPALGWRVDVMSIGGRNLTMTLRNDKRLLVLVDFAGWVPTSLDQIAAMMGRSKLPLPDDDDPRSVWLDRCRRDVELLHDANREVIDWIVDHDLGNWQKTGASFAWANFRHRHMSDRILTHGDATATVAEVAAIGTGRCEVWRHGLLADGTWTEWDFPAAYPRVCLDTALPVMLLGHDERPDLDFYLGREFKGRAILHCRVTTDVPVLGVRTDTGWLWPTGEFSGWWWDHEVSLAREFGATVECDRAVFYRGRQAMRPWAEWILPVIEDPKAGATELQRAAAKHWSRAAIGRLGAKYPRWEHFAPAPPGALELRCYVDLDKDRRGQMLLVAGSTYVSTDEGYVADANPAMMGAIMSECRVRLWRTLTIAGAAHVAYCDTDSLIVDAEGHRRLASAARHGLVWGMRVKATYEHLEVLGPRQLVTGLTPRIAGVARGAERVSDREFVGKKWDGVTATLQSGTPDVVVVRKVKWTIRATDRRRDHLAGGVTRAKQVEVAG